jgi:hypothetical protein
MGNIILIRVQIFRYCYYTRLVQKDIEPKLSFSYAVYFKNKWMLGCEESFETVFSYIHNILLFEIVFSKNYII